MGKKNQRQYKAEKHREFKLKDILLRRPNKTTYCMRRHQRKLKQRRTNSLSDIGFLQIYVIKVQYIRNFK